MADVKCDSCGFVNFAKNQNTETDQHCTNCGNIISSINLTQCHSCGKTISKNATECPKCGVKSQTECQICQEKIQFDSTSCPECGDPEPFKIQKTNEKTVAIKSPPKVQNIHLNNVNQDQNNMAPHGSNHPWRRFLARTVDLFSGGLLMFILFILAISFFIPQSASGLVKALENPIIAGIILYLLWVPVEALFLSMFGATPAKWVFGIQVLSKTGNKLNYATAIKRTVNVWLQGEGMGIPLVTLITRLFAYKRLTKTNTTLWDTSVESVVTHKQWGIGRAIFSTLVTFITICFVGILNNM